MNTTLQTTSLTEHLIQHRYVPPFIVRLVGVEPYTGPGQRSTRFGIYFERDDGYTTTVLVVALI